MKTSFLIFLTILSWSINTKAQLLEYREEGQLEKIPCRPEDGYHKCLSWDSVVICVPRTLADYYCKDYPDKRWSCTDDEVMFDDTQIEDAYADEDSHRCQPRSGALISRYIRCHPNEFRCFTSKKCIPRSRVQDGGADCLIDILFNFLWRLEDSSDEEHFLQNCNHATEYRCHGDMARCISRQMVMDGKDDCPNGTDEADTLTCHRDTEFLCSSNKRCILRRYVNDHFTDCPNGTDENVRNFTCIDHLEFSCRNSRCIPRQWVGNGVEDCSSGEDETTFLSKCFDEEFGCSDHSRCLPKKYLCDGVQNCRDGSDEIELCKSPTMYRSPDTQTLIPWSNLLGDTIPFEIEQVVHPAKYLMFGFKCHTKIATFVRSKQQYHVSVNLRTIPQFYIENNHSVCYNKEDVCYDDKGTFKCARCFDGTIISTSQLCDNKVDCRDLSDECTCEESKVERLCEMVYPTSYLQHNWEENKLELDLICNGHEDVESGIDEQFCVDEVLQFRDTATEHMISRLENMTCGPSDNQTLASYCDGKVQCPDKEDECYSDCIKSKLSSNNVTQETLNNCFSFLIPLNNTADDFHHFWFETKLVGSSLTKEILLQPENEPAKNNICQYNITLYNEVLAIEEYNGKADCNFSGDYTSMGFLCDIEGVECPWLYSCESDRTRKIEVSKRCDYNIDCEDGSDEKQCSSETHFYCRSGTPLFINNSQVSDGRSDCTDRSDECRETPFSSVKEMIKNEFLQYFVWVAAFCIIISNIAVIRKHFSKIKKIVSKKSIPFWNTILLINLACSDMIFGFTLLSIGIKSQQLSGKYCEFDLMWRSSLPCNMIGIFTVISSQTSIHMLVLMTGLRLYTTYRPYLASELNMKILTFLTILSWVVSTLIALFPVWSNELFVYSVYIESNYFFKDQIVTPKEVERYVRRTENLFHHHNGCSKSFGDSFRLNNLNDWFFNKNQSRAKFPHRNVEYKGNFGFYSSSSVCFPDLYVQVSLLSQYSLAFVCYNSFWILMISIGYFLIIKHVRANHKGVKLPNWAENDDRKMTIRIICIVLTDMVCWFPIIGMSIASHQGHEFPQVIHILSTIVFLPVNSFLNPIIYSKLCSPICSSLNENIEESPFEVVKMQEIPQQAVS